MEPLLLPTDGVVRGTDLKAYVTAWAGVDRNRQELAEVILAIADTSPSIAARLAQGRLPGAPDAVLGVNASGDKQKALDLAAHDAFIDAFDNVSIAKVLSEEADDIIEIDASARYDIAIDPIDGSGSIGIGAPLGTLFCIFPAGPSFLRSGRDIVAAGYISFGHSVDFGFCLGGQVKFATLDPVSGRFFLENEAGLVAEHATTIAFNASNQRRWPEGLQHYTHDILLGRDGPRKQDFNMRWIAAAVGDLHRILRRGGFFMYPADNREGYQQGFLRLLYEAFPIAFLIEKAGGAATNGQDAILDLMPDHIHAKTPLFFGAKDEAEVVRNYFTSSARQETNNASHHASTTA